MAPLCFQFLSIHKMERFFITGTGTGVGKTVVSAIVTEALQADYWKPVQAGYEDGTDALTIQQLISNKRTVIHPEAFVLKMPASPHLAAPAEGIDLTINKVFEKLPETKNCLIIEGAGGLMVPFNNKEFTPDLIKKIGCSVILVSKNELGSINHSLLTAAVCKQYQIPVAGWIFTGEYKNYEEDIVRWTGYRKIFSVKEIEVNKENILKQAELLKTLLKHIDE